MFYYRDRNYRRNMPPPNHMYPNEHNMSQTDDNSPAEDIQEDKQNEKMQQEHIHEKAQVADINTQAEVDSDLIEEAIEEQEHKVCDENNASAEPVSKANSDTKKESVDEAEALFDPINDLLGIYKMMVKTKKSKK